MERNGELENREKKSKFYTISMVLIISILFVGFIFMSLILIDILNIVNGLALDFIEFIKSLL